MVGEEALRGFGGGQIRHSWTTTAPFSVNRGVYTHQSTASVKIALALSTSDPSNCLRSPSSSSRPPSDPPSMHTSHISKKAPPDRLGSVFQHHSHGTPDCELHYAFSHFQTLTNLPAKFCNHQVSSTIHSYITRHGLRFSLSESHRFFCAKFLAAKRAYEQQEWTQINTHSFSLSFKRFLEVCDLYSYTFDELIS